MRGGRAGEQEGASVGELALVGGDEDAEAGAVEERDAADIEVHGAAACLLVFFEQFGESVSVGEVPFAVRASRASRCESHSDGCGRRTASAGD